MCADYPGGHLSEDFVDPEGSVWHGGDGGWGEAHADRLHVHNRPANVHRASTKVSHHPNHTVTYTSGFEYSYN